MLPHSPNILLPLSQLPKSTSAALPLDAPTLILSEPSLRPPLEPPYPPVDGPPRAPEPLAAAPSQPHLTQSQAQGSGRAPTRQEMAASAVRGGGAHTPIEHGSAFAFSRTFVFLSAYMHNIIHRSPTVGHRRGVRAVCAGRRGGRPASHGAEEGPGGGARGRGEGGSFSICPRPCRPDVVLAFASSSQPPNNMKSLSSPLPAQGLPPGALPPHAPPAAQRAYSGYEAVVWAARVAAGCDDVTFETGSEPPRASAGHASGPGEVGEGAAPPPGPSEGEDKDALDSPGATPHVRLSAPTAPPARDAEAEAGARWVDGAMPLPPWSGSEGDLQLPSAVLSPGARAGGSRVRKGGRSSFYISLLFPVSL